MTHAIVEQFVQVSGLIYFFGIFIGVLIYVFWPSNREAFEKAAHLPLDENGD
ncbi:MAG: cbb3-type cytochrome c oxidase subunit 3 [Rhodospirillaceae bacterium]|nr:MAG: cbb3-type cytochrome c oxidase subunit 3 [Rhodospirillaceae bacterium]